jgi:hypothetical protein
MAGLAQELAGSPSAPMNPQNASMVPQGAPSGQAAMPSLEEVINLLMQGADPEELVQMGVPPELIMEAISVIEQQMQAQGGQPAQAAAAPQEPGLAQSMGGM